MTDNEETLGVVYVVDDDDAVRDSLQWLLEASSHCKESRTASSSSTTYTTPSVSAFSFTFGSSVRLAFRRADCR